MRFFWAGILQLLLLTSSLWAGVIGKVESIGFGSYVRPDCWVPLIIQTSSDEDGPREFDLQIVQLDQDGDEAVYTREKITVNPGSQSFWTYFKPEPVNGGIPARGATNAPDLAKRIRIFLADPDSKKRLVQVATAGNLPQALEFGDYAITQGQKLIVVVGRAPTLREYDQTPIAGKLPPVLGMMELPMFVRSDVKHLPENAIAYESVDAVVWTDAEIDKMSPAQMRALRQFVTGGGRLVVIQNAEIARFAQLDEFLPVKIEGVQEWNSQEPLKSILMPLGATPPRDPRDRTKFIDPFKNVRGPYRMAKATALPDAVVDSWVTWPDKTKTPLIARRLYGLGSVSWVAQDITDPSVAAAEHGWPRFWERVFGWKNDEQVFTSTLFDLAETERRTEPYLGGGAKEIGRSYLEGTDLTGKTAALISLAFVFFIGYWLIAGPGSYLFLAARRRTSNSWFVYGAIAVAATALTMLISQLVLRGDAQIRHLTLVRVRCDDASPATVMSRFGIYIPQDTRAPVTLTKRDTSMPATVTPLVLDPRPERKATPRDSSYEVPILSEDAETEVGIRVPFRSTLKKLQAEWHGTPPGKISGKPALQERGILVTGQLTNNTGADLTRVTIVFPYPGLLGDQVLYIPKWDKGATLDLAKEWPEKQDPQPAFSGEKRRGALRFAQKWLYDDLRTSMASMSSSNVLDDSGNYYQRSFPLASLFDRLQPMRNETSVNRVDIQRRGIRKWDVSGALAAGAMVILAQSIDAPLPIPLEVDGAAPQGTGHIFWQFIIPLDREKVKSLERGDDDEETKATTQPTTN